jgi:hypothetical protein
MGVIYDSGSGSLDRTRVQGERRIKNGSENKWNSGSINFFLMVSITGTIYAWCAAGLSGANKLGQYFHGSARKATAETKEKEADDQELRRHAENEQRHGRDDALI